MRIHAAPAQAVLSECDATFLNPCPGAPSRLGKTASKKRGKAFWWRIEEGKGSAEEGKGKGVKQKKGKGVRKKKGKGVRKKAGKGVRESRERGQGA